MKEFRILVAEDDAVSRKILERHLQKWGYHVTCTIDGEAAWRELEAGGYHIAILDWNMPGMSGTQICERVRQEPSLSRLYLILLTGRTERTDVRIGFESGADDYVIKPYDPSELFSRLKVASRLVDSWLLLRRKNEELNTYAKEMESLAEQRSKMLIHADRLATLGTLTAGVAHEINNPNTFISGNAQTLQRCWPTIEAHLRHALEVEPENRKLATMVAEVPKMLDGIRYGVTRITTIINGLKSFAGVGKNIFEICDINKCLSNALLLCAPHLKYVELEKNMQSDLPSLWGDSQRLEQVFINLFTNAADALDEMPRSYAKHLAIETRLEGGTILVTISNNGPNIPQPKLDNIWQPFFTTKKVGKGTGLGLSISQGIVHDHKGTISVENLPETGVRFKIDLPLNAKGEHS